MRSEESDWTLQSFEPFDCRKDVCYYDLHDREFSLSSEASAFLTTALELPLPEEFVNFFVQHAIRANFNFILPRQPTTGYLRDACLAPWLVREVSGDANQNITAALPLSEHNDAGLFRMTCKGPTVMHPIFSDSQYSLFAAYGMKKFLLFLANLVEARHLLSEGWIRRTVRIMLISCNFVRRKTSSSGR